MQEEVKYRVMFWHKEGKGLIGKFYDLPHIPRLNEQVYLERAKYRVINVLTTPGDDESDIDIDLELVS